MCIKRTQRNSGRRSYYDIAAVFVALGCRRGHGQEKHASPATRACMWHDQTSRTACVASPANRGCMWRDQTSHTACVVLMAAVVVGKARSIGEERTRHCYYAGVSRRHPAPCFGGLKLQHANETQVSTVPIRHNIPTAQALFIAWAVSPGSTFEAKLAVLWTRL